MKFRVAMTYTGFPGGSVVRNPPAMNDTGGAGVTPESGGLLGEGTGNPL